MKDLIKEIENGGVEYVSPEETDIDYYNDLNRIEVESGLYIYPWKHLSVIAIKNGRCVGGMYEGIIHNTFSFDVIVDSGTEKKIFSLNRSYYGLYIQNGLWRQMQNFSTNSLALVLSSTHYNSEDYIYNYEDFLNLKYNNEK